MTVEFIIKELNNIKSSSTDKNNEIKFLNKEFNMILEKALEMEKKNTIAFGYRCIGEVDSELGDLIYKKVPEEVYNETFK